MRNGTRDTAVVVLACATALLWIKASAVEAPPKTSVPKASANANDWPQWHGPNRDGNASNSPKLLDSWPKNGPRLLWKSEPIPGSGLAFAGPGQPASWVATDGGLSSPVVAGGCVFLYADWAKKYAVTRKMLADWGWMDGVPDELAVKVEEARITGRKGKNSPAELEKYVVEILSKLDPEQAKKFGEHIRKRISLGDGTAIWWDMAAIVDAGAPDKVFSTYAEWRKNSFKGDAIRGHAVLVGPGDWDNYISNTVMKEAERTDTVFCLDAATGKQLWKAEFPGEVNAAYGNYFWGGVSATPAISNGKCYVAGSAGLYCLSAKDGSLVWKAKTSFTHSSPLVANGKVYGIFTHSKSGNVNSAGELTAFDAQTGNVLWRQGSVKNTYDSVALWIHEGKSYVVSLGDERRLFCIDADTGAVLWKSEPIYYESCATPVVVGDIAVVRGSTALRLTPQKAEVLWKGGPSNSYYGGDPVVYQDNVYVSSAYAPGCCLDLKTGKVNWKENAFSVIQAPVAADDKIFCYEADFPGVSIVMLKATPEKFVKLGQFTPGSRALKFSSPAVAGGKLYLRLSDCVACYDLTTQ